MFTLIDLGGAPACEPTAQLGQTEGFDRLNRLEVECYRAAIQAKFGPPPAGCQLAITYNRHDFGSYQTLSIKVWEHAAASEDVAAYLTEAEDGLGSWMEAGFRAPVEYVGSQPIAGSAREIKDCIISALKTTRPGSDGLFPLSDFAVLHCNLSAIYPECASQALLQLGGTSL